MAALIALFIAVDASVPTLVSWLKAQPGAAVGPVSFGESGCGAGVGGFAARDIAENEALISIPCSAILSISGSSKFEKLEREEGLRAGLAAVLAREQLAGGSSPFEPYLELLPQRQEQEAQHPLWWTARERELLRGTSSHTEMASIATEVEDVQRVLSRGRSALLKTEVATHGQWKVDEAVPERRRARRTSLAIAAEPLSAYIITLALAGTSCVRRCLISLVSARRGRASRCGRPPDAAARPGSPAARRATERLVQLGDECVGRAADGH